MIPDSCRQRSSVSLTAVPRNHVEHSIRKARQLWTLSKLPSPCHYFEKRKKKNNKAKVFQHPFDSQSASCSLISRHVLSELGHCAESFLATESTGTVLVPRLMTRIAGHGVHVRVLVCVHARVCAWVCVCCYVLSPQRPSHKTSRLGDRILLLYSARIESNWTSEKQQRGLRSSTQRERYTYGLAVWPYKELGLTRLIHYMCVCVYERERERERVCVCVGVFVCVCVTMKKGCQTNGKPDKRHRRYFK